ncbi:hypothetical protein J7M28_10205 [bacterium]|nr:hypothetical protein [bacterium]
MTQRDRDNSGASWFQKNPAKTVISFCLLVSLVLVFGVELVLKMSDTTSAQRKRNRGGIKRSIRLREHKPNSIRYRIPSDEYMAKVDSLTRREFRLATDENGFILPSKKHDAPDLSIFFLGGSTTECRFTDEQNRFPYLVGNYLEESTGKKVNSFNGGVSGSNSLHSLDILINKVIPLGPDIVVLMHNVNDLNILIYERTYWNKNPTRSVVQRVKKKKSASFGSNVLKTIRRSIPELYRRFEGLSRNLAPPRPPDEFAHLRGQKLSIERERFVKEFEMNLRTFVNVCRARGITPVLMTQANRLKPEPDEIIHLSLTDLYDFGISYEAYIEAYEAFNECIRELAAKDGVLLIDLAREIPPEKKYMYDFIHFNDEGARLAASIIAESLLPHLSWEDKAQGDAGRRVGK